MNQDHGIQTVLNILGDFSDERDESILTRLSSLNCIMNCFTKNISFVIFQLVFLPLSSLIT